MLELHDKKDLRSTLLHYYTFLRGQVELDQFVEGLHTYSVLTMIREYPSLMKPLFVHINYKLMRGSPQKLVWTTRSYICILFRSCVHIVQMALWRLKTERE